MKKENLRLPKKYNEVQEKLNDLICTVEYKENMDNPLAYTCRNIGERSGFSYKIVCSNDRKDLTPFLLSHEAGHIILNHTKDLSVSDFLVKGKIKSCWDKVSKYFEGKDLEETFKYFEGYLYNVVMDWEVNSKILDLEEIEYMEEIVNKDKETKEIEFLYPTRNNYPEKKNWMEYLTYIVLDPEEFFKNMTQPNNQQGQGQQGQGQQGQGQQNKNGQGQQNKNGQGQQKFKDLPDEAKKQIINDFFDKMKASSEKEEKKEEASRKDENGELSGFPSNENKDISKQVDQNDMLDGFPSMSNKGSDSVEVDNFVENYNNENLEKLLLNCLKSESKVLDTKDIVYYYNRRKFGTNVLYTRKKENRIKKHNNSMTVLLDVSGSINSYNIKMFIDVFKRVSKKLNKRCHLILWNTKKVVEYDTFIDKNIIARSGGGTNMSSGLEYIQNNSKYNNSTVIIVSDFEDNIDDWKFNKKIYGICWDKYIFESIQSNEQFKGFFDLFKKVFVSEE